MPEALVVAHLLPQLLPHRLLPPPQVPSLQHQPRPPL